MTVEGAHQRARAAWPDVDIAAQRFADYVAERADAGVALHLEDLYLACGCADGVPAALEAFERTCMPVAIAAVRRVSSNAALADDVAQELRAYLFVGRPGIAGYRGRGSLCGWTRVIAIRMARKQLGGPSTATLGDDALSLVADARLSPELAALKQQHREALKRALQRAIAAESSEARNLLRHHLLDNLSLGQIGALYHLDKATISRRLAKIRASLASTVQRTLRETLGLTGTEIESLARLVESELDASLPRLLNGDPPT